MIFLHPDLYVRVEEYSGKNAPVPRPLENGFSEGKIYKVLGAHNASETSECYIVLSNDNEEIWMISNRHLRTHGIKPMEIT